MLTFTHVVTEPTTVYIATMHHRTRGIPKPKPKPTKTKAKFPIPKSSNWPVRGPSATSYLTTHMDSLTTVFFQITIMSCVEAKITGHLRWLDRTRNSVEIDLGQMRKWTELLVNFPIDGAS